VEFEPQVFYDITDVIDEKVELIEIFWSQNAKLYLKANAIKGLAEYRALQSRLNSHINYVESFEVVKLCLDKQFRLMKVPQAADSVKRIPEQERELEYAWNKR
jgi:hypothetical protein